MKSKKENKVKLTPKNNGKIKRQIITSIARPAADLDLSKLSNIQDLSTSIRRAIKDANFSINHSFLRAIPEALEHRNIAETSSRSWVAMINAKAKKDSEEAEIRRLTLKKLRTNKRAITNSPPIYDFDSSCIIFRNKAFLIPRNSNQAALCKVLFKDAKTMRKEWTWDEIIEAWGDIPNYDSNDGWKKIYSACRHLNIKVSPSGVSDLFLRPDSKSVKINPKYL